MEENTKIVDSSEMNKNLIETEEIEIDKAEALRQRRRKASHQAKKRKRQKELEKYKHLFIDKTEEEIEQIREQIKKEKELKQRAFEESINKGQRVCIDVHFNETMTEMEQASLLTQLSLCQKANKESLTHVCLHVCGITPSTNKVLEMFGAKNWVMNFHEEPFEKVFDTNECIYMSPDGDSVLETLDPSKVYIIGGIVDRTISKNLSYLRAQSLNIPTYKLPIEKYVPKCERPVLNINTMVELFLRLLQTNDWSHSFEVCLPRRKKVQHSNIQEYDYHTIEEENKDVRSIKINELYQYQLKHHLHIFCEKNHIKVNIQHIDHLKEGHTGEDRCECVISFNNQVIGHYTTKNSRYAEAMASYDALLYLEKEFGRMELKKKVDSTPKDSIENQNSS